MVYHIYSTMVNTVSITTILSFITLTSAHGIPRFLNGNDASLRRYGNDDNWEAITRFRDGDRLICNNGGDRPKEPMKLDATQPLKVATRHWGRGYNGEDDTAEDIMPQNHHGPCLVYIAEYSTSILF